MLTEIRIPLTEAQGALIEKAAVTAGVTVDAVVEDAASYILRCLHLLPCTTSGNAERFVEAYFPEELRHELHARMATDHWSVAAQ
jgi:hypothetical protein